MRRHGAQHEARAVVQRRGGSCLSGVSAVEALDHAVDGTE